jgi:peptidyl-prolyl cis-trans isomerase C
MKRTLISTLVGTLLIGGLAPLALAQNVAIVNGKAVPVSRVEALAQQVAKSRPGRSTPVDAGPAA